MPTRRTAPEVLTVPQACEFLSVSERTLRGWVARGYVPYARIGNQLRFRREALIEWLKEREREAREGSK